MGSNVHVHWLGESLKSVPEELTGRPNCATVMRYNDGHKFVQAVWNSPGCDFVRDCVRRYGKECEDCYICSSVARPKDFNALRLATKDLQPVWQILIDYLESEPNAYLEYD